MNATLQLSPHSLPQASAWWESRRLLIPLWLLSGLMLLGSVFLIDVQRSQEARIHETAREMIEGNWRQWLVPLCNGKVRLQKPPLGYWLAAGSFKVFGVSDWAGRVPFVIVAWLTIGLTWSMTKMLAGARAGLFAAATLAGTLLFFKYSRYAETDTLVTLTVTAAIAATINAWAARGGRRAVFWHHVAAIAIGLTVLGKGLQAIFPLLFLIGLAWVSGRWKLLREWAVSGAPLTAAIIAVPWFIFIAQTPESKIIAKELMVIATGPNHGQWPHFYFLVIFKATAPWSGLLVLGLVWAIARWKRKLRARILLIWAASVFVPLSIVPQKQEHYMLPLMPALMAMIGVAFDRSLRADDPKLSRATALVLMGTAIGGLIAAPGPIIAAKMFRGAIQPLDVALCLLLAASMGAILLAFRRARLLEGMPRASGLVMATVVVGGTLMAIVLGYWLPSLEKCPYDQVAARIQREFADSEVVMFEQENLPLCFYMGRTVPYYHKPPELAEALVRQPRLAIIWEQKKGEGTPPPGREKLRLNMTKRDIVVYQAD